MVSVVEGRKIYDVTDGLKAERTKEEYGRAFNVFLKYTGMQEKLLQILQLQPNKIEEIIADYLLSLKQRGLKHSSIINAKAAILHFFVINRVQLNSKWIGAFIEPDESHHEDRAYTDAEVQKLLAASDERFKVIILLLASTGMRKGAIPELRIGDLSAMNIAGISTYRFWIYNRSAKDRYYCFATPELKTQIDRYLDYRKRFGEILTPEAPLIRDQFDIYDPRAAKKPKPLSVNTFDKAMRRLVAKAGIGQSTRGECQLYNAFRKRVLSILIRSKADYSTREYILGHRHSRGLEVHYDRTTEEERFIEWSKAIDLLTVDPTQRLEKKVQQLEGEQSKRITQLEAQMRKYQETFIINDRIAKHMGLSKEEFGDVLIRRHKRYHPEDKDKDLKASFPSDFEY
jgi:integrase/predicted HTH domain antitoxin